MTGRRVSIEEHLTRFNVNPATGCHEWAGTKNSCGYGQAKQNRGGIVKNLLMHRVSYEFHRDAIPEGLHILHSCHNPSCINPEHLRTGTHKENMADKKARGKYIVEAPDYWASRITIEQVDQILSLSAAGYSSQAICRKLQVNCRVVPLVRKGLRAKESSNQKQGVG